MSIFQKVKEAVSTKDAASFYGIKVGRNGLCRCPFHNDRTPSMKVDVRYYCFGCGETGDVIDFVGKLYGLKPYDAARKLADDFGITDYSSYSSNNKFQSKRAPDIEIRDALFSLHQYREKLRIFKQDYAPRSIYELDDCNPLFEEALMNLSKTDWMIEELTFGSRDEQLTFLTNYKGEIEHVKTRLSELN